MSGRIKKDNFIVVFAWMFTELKLKSNELIVFAIIYGFSQDGVSEFTGSLSYIQEFIGVSKPTVINAIDSLVNKQYIIKTENTINGVKFNRYKVNLPVVKKLYQGGKETLPGVVKNFNQGSKKTLPNNINNNIDINNKDIYIQKHKYGEYQNVLLSDKELDQLKEYISSKYEINDTTRFIDDCIIHLDEYIEIKAPKYKSHYLVIKKWVADEVKKKFVDTVSNDFDFERAVEDDDFFS